MYQLPCDKEINEALNALFITAAEKYVGDPDSEEIDISMEFIPAWCSKQRAIEEYKELWRILHSKEEEVPELLGEYINAHIFDCYIEYLDLSGEETDLKVSDKYIQKLLEESEDDFDDGDSSDEEIYLSAQSFVEYFLDLHNWKEHLWDIDYELLDMIPEDKLRGSALDHAMGIYPQDEESKKEKAKYYADVEEGRCIIIPVEYKDKWYDAIVMEEPDFYTFFMREKDSHEASGIGYAAKDGNPIQIDLILEENLTKMVELFEAFNH